MNEHHVILHLSLIEGVGPAVIKTIIENKPKALAWQALYGFSVSDWHQLGMTERRAHLLVAGLKDRSSFEKELALIEKHAINWTTPLDSKYPDQLRHIHTPPAILYWYGDLTYEKAIAIVGSRDANSYGERQINRMVAPLVKHNFCIVSGGALGADTMAHRATLNAGGKTIVVLGSGLLHFAPRTNARLFETVLERGGAIVSAFACDVTPKPENFPARNRVIAGLSQGIVVAQAAEKSGARITAQYALEQGRDVFAIPGSLDDPLSAGCHALIQEGAMLAMGPDGILKEYGISQSASPEAQSGIPFDKGHEKRHIKKKPKALKKAGNPLHEKIISACVHGQSIDVLARECNLDLSQMQKELFELQINGVVEQDFSGMWKAI